MSFAFDEPPFAVAAAVTLLDHLVDAVVLQVEHALAVRAEVVERHAILRQNKSTTFVINNNNNNKYELICHLITSSFFALSLTDSQSKSTPSKSPVSGHSFCSLLLRVVDITADVAAAAAAAATAAASAVALPLSSIRLGE